MILYFPVERTKRARLVHASLVYVRARLSLENDERWFQQRFSEEGRARYFASIPSWCRLAAAIDDPHELPDYYFDDCDEWPASAD